MKNNKSRLFCYILVAALLACMLSVAAFAAGPSGSCGDGVYWRYDQSTATLTVSGEGHIKSYEVFDMNSMTSTDPAPWSDYMDEVETIIIEDGIISIGASAFKYGYNLKHIELPNTLTHVFNYAFIRCGEVERIVIPASVTYIGCNVFLGQCEESKPYIYFLGKAPDAKESGTLSRSFSDHTVLYFLDDNSRGSSWKGYQADIWNGADFVDPLYTGEADSNDWEGSWNDTSKEAYDVQVEITGTQCYSYAYEVINRLNQLRIEKGVDPLKIDDKLMETAMRRAAECATYYSHTRPNGTSAFSIFPTANSTGENIACGYRSAEDVMSGWENSPGHYANMVNDRFTSVGVGCFYIDGAYFWTQAFTDGLARNHETKSDTEKTETISMAYDLFSLQTDNPKIMASVGEPVSIPFKLLNKGYNNHPTTFQPSGSISCRKPLFIEIVEWDPLTVMSESAWTGELTVTLWDSVSTSFDLEVRELFDDVSRGSWYYDSVGWATKHNLIDPASSTRFEPEATMTRATTAILLYRLEGKPASRISTTFTDIPHSECAAAASWASTSGIMKGYGNGLFGPNDPLTREQMATVLYRYAQYKGERTAARSNLSAYSDQYSIGDYAIDAMKWANAEGYITGTSSTTLSPTKANSRAEAATIFMRFSESI